jgi:hypothetical protein
MISEHDEVVGKIGTSLLAVEPGDEAWIEVFRPGVRQLVEHPRLDHAPILAPPHKRQLNHSHRVHTPRIADPLDANSGHDHRWRSTPRGQAVRIGVGSGCVESDDGCRHG